MSNLSDTFNEVYRLKSWGDGESLSGLGSSALFADSFYNHLTDIIKQHGITSVTDLSCGDCNWISKLFGSVRYFGYDVSDHIINVNKIRYENDKTSFRSAELMDVLKIPRLHELCIIRHTFEHLPTEYIAECLALLKTKTQFAIITSANNHEGPTEDIAFGANSREINLLKSPFIEILGRPATTFWDTIGPKADRGCFGYFYQFG